MNSRHTTFSIRRITRGYIDYRHLARSLHYTYEKKVRAMTKKLMIIDSEPFDREIAGKIFSSKYDLAFAENLFEFETSCEGFKPNVVLFELREPNEWQLREAAIVCKFRCPPLPLVLVISENSMELEATARSYGVFYCLIRPFNLKELWDVLDAAFAFANKPDVHQAMIESKKIRI